MDITVVHVADCPHASVAQQRLGDALAQLGIGAVVRQRLVTSEDDAATAGFRGSPTILIDGHDPFRSSDEPAGLACRLYPTDDGPKGAPTVSSLVEVLLRHQRKSPLERSLGDQLAPQVRWAAFDQLRNGSAITQRDLATHLGVSTNELEPTIDALAGAGLIERDPTGAVVGAHGLTLYPTRHHVVLAGTGLHTWCALDAIGIPAALGGDAEIATCCGWCDRPLSLFMHGGAPAPASEMVLWLPREPCTNIRQQFCPQANLFCDRDHLERWREQAGRPHGDTLTVPEAAELGRDWWQRDEPDCCGDATTTPAAASTLVDDRTLSA